MDTISFDFAADFYDATRGFPPGVGDQVAAALLAKLGDHSSVLEIGVGTGRISLSLLEQLRGYPGYTIYGVDISERMLSRLRSNLQPGIRSPSLVLGDARTLPFPSGQFDAILMVHLIHLISDWKSAIIESRRVLGTHGALYFGYESSDPDTAPIRLRKVLNQIIMESYPEASQFGPANNSDKIAWLTSTGASLDTSEVASWTMAFNVGDTIRRYENGTYSATWRLPVAVRTQVISRLRDWAVAEFGSLDAEFEVAHRFIWECFRWGD